ncbi:MAG: PucR family transcriptional regulator ligand-binding domain-containing protein [Eubacteriales bacterium]|nr:PucR family transcriptional regulator ligand-binding domain-containing protein [Eubacteriales bacterium]
MIKTMSLSVRELLKIQSQLANEPEMELLAGEQGLDNKIRGVTIIEAPDIVKFIEGGELLLTGLYAFKTCTVEEFAKYIAALHEKTVSAVFLKLGREVDLADEKIKLLKDYCNQFQIPLVNIPFHVSFQVIMSLVMENLFNEEVTRLKYYKTTSDNFCALSLSPAGGSIEQILGMLEKLIRNPIAIFDQRNQCLYASNNEYRESDDFPNLFLLDPKIISRNHYYLQEGEPNRYRVDMQLASGQELYLLVWEVQSPFSALDIIAIENALVALQYEFFRQYSIFELEQKFHNDLIESTLNGKLSSKDEIERSRVFTGLSPEATYRVVCFAFSNLDDSVDFNKQILEINLLKDCVGRLIPGGQLHYTLDRVAWIQPVAREQSLIDYRAWFHEFYNKLSSCIKEKDEHLSLVAGIGRVVQGISALQHSYEEATDALAAISLEGVANSITDQNCLLFSDLGIFKLLYGIDSSEKLMEFVPESLLSLYNSDNKQKDELIQTLDCYLANQLNLSQTAKDLFIHYKTAMYRLNRIKEITGIDFENANEVLSVRIGMIVYQMAQWRSDNNNFKE